MVKVLLQQPPSYESATSSPASVAIAEARKRRIATGSQSLDAEFDLLDLLSIRSHSGSVKVGIHPKPADEANPVPAELQISSHSGSIDVNFVDFIVPERDYYVSIDSQSGSINGAILHGRKTSITTQSARINLNLTPFGAGDYSSNVSTISSSGSQDIVIQSPTRYLGTPIKEMSSVHSSASGSLVLRYPREWEGTIEGHTQSGSIKLHGGDLDLIQTGGHHVRARKGNGNSSLTFSTGSGSINIYFY